MTDLEFKRIKEKIATASTKASEANGKLLAIKEQWKNKYGFDTLEDAKKKLEEIKEDIRNKEEMRNKFMEELENSFDWSSIA